ncbi:MAG: hypothetical protein ACP5NF_03120 [Thermoanaerobaculum sp.]
MRRIWGFLAALLPAVGWAVGPGTDLWIPSVGHGPGQFGSQWRTDVWVSRPTGTTAATVDIYFLPRGDSNAWPPESRPITVNPGETREFVDIVKDLFGKDNAFGALRFLADQEVLVTARIYSAGLTIVTNDGNKTGSAGQFFAALPAAAAVGLGQSTDVQGVAQDSGTRTNVGWVEVTGNPCSIQVQRVDGNGVVVASQTYNVGAFAVVQKGNILNELGGPGGNQRLRITVVSGSGKILAFGSRLDNASNDPSTIEMRTAALVDRSQGRFAGTLESGGQVLGGLAFTIVSNAVGGFLGNGTVDCEGVPYTLDFGPSSTPVVLDANGSFAMALTHDYFDGTTKVLTVTWTVTGTVSSTGTASGAVAGQVTFAAGTSPWNACTGLSETWRAGWVSP